MILTSILLSDINYVSILDFPYTVTEIEGYLGCLTNGRWVGTFDKALVEFQGDCEYLLVGFSEESKLKVSSLLSVIKYRCVF